MRLIFLLTILIVLPALAAAHSYEKNDCSRLLEVGRKPKFSSAMPYVISDDMVRVFLTDDHLREVHRRFKIFMDLVEPLVPADAKSLVMFRLVTGTRPGEYGYHHDVLTRTIEVKIHPQIFTEPAIPPAVIERYWRETYIIVAHEMGHLVALTETEEEFKDDFIRYLSKAPRGDLARQMRWLELIVNEKPNDFTAQARETHQQLTAKLSRLLIEAQPNVDPKWTPTADFFRERMVAAHELFADLFPALVFGNMNIMSEVLGEEGLLTRNRAANKYRSFHPSRTKISTVELDSPYYWLGPTRGMLARTLRLSPEVKPARRKKWAAEIRAAVNESVATIRLRESTDHKFSKMELVKEQNRVLSEAIARRLK